MIPFRRRPNPVAAVENAVIPVLIAAATFVAAEPWLRVFSVPGTLALVIVAAVLPVAIGTAVIRVGRQPPPVSYVLSAVGLLVVLLAANGFHLGQVGHGLRTGPNQVFTETLPLGGNRGTLSAPVLVIWIAGAASTELIVRSRRARTGLAAIGLGIPVASYVVAYAVSASRPGSDTIGAPILLVLVSMVAVLRHGARLATTATAGVGTTVEASGRAPTWRPGAVASIAVAVVAAVLAGTFPSIGHLSHRPATLHRSPPLAEISVLDPVDALAALRDENPHGPAQPELEVSTNRASTGYLGMAVLDNYDGASWTFSATFQPTGGRVPLAPGAPGAVIDQRAVRQSVTLSAPLVVPLLPALDRPVAVGGVEVAVDATTGMLVSSHSLTVGTTYVIDSEAPTETLSQVSSADEIDTSAGARAGPTAGSSNVADVALPPGSNPAMGTLLKFLSAQTGQRPAATVAFLQAVVSALHADERRIDPTLPIPPPPVPKKSSKKKSPPATTTTTIPAPNLAAAGATSLSEVINAVTFSRSGTPEQFATMLAMVARYLGIPARLVTGYRMADSSSGTPLPPGSYQVTNRQAWAWVEIPVAGMGWVVMDPTPDTRASAPPPQPEAATATATTLPPPRANAVPVSQEGGHALAKPATVQTPKSHHVPWWEPVLLAVVGLVVLLLLLGPGLAGLRRISRRRARRSSDPAHLAVGAWLELLDGLQQAGMATSRGATGAEVAAEAGHHFGVEVTDPVQDVARLADRALCSTVPPPLDDAEAAWQSQRTLRRTIHRGLDRRQRSRALMSVGSAPRRPGR